MRIRHPLALLAIIASAAAATGCSAALPSAAAAADVASRFSAAIATEDGAAACGLLAPGALHTVEEATGASCPTGILSLDLPSGGPAVGDEAYGRAAVVRLENDTVFLTIAGGQWAVRAAGCTPNGDAPYDCTVTGD
ncbi:hypothetical protein C5B96_10385 [Subtercola sp. Z020]|nr:hypothetical protein C5B96_10385 [Subtercola sp. Z020]